MSNASPASTNSDVIPKKLFHLTPKENLVSILEHGLRSVWGNYFSSDIQTATKLMAFQIVTKPVDTEWIAVEIRTEDLEVERSTDHSVAFFGTDDSWVIWEDVPANYIEHIYEVEIET